MNAIRMKLLNELLHHRHMFLSGEDLSGRLHVSRTAIWKHIEELRKEGYDIEAVRKQGYKIMSIPNKLTASTILPYLQTKWLGQSLHVFDEVESTQFLAQGLARKGSESGTVVIADHQTAGKGRMGRKWYSPPGTGVWMSLILRPDIPLTSAPQLTLLTSVAVLRGIQQLTGLKPGIKWPNDVLIDGKKVAGILTELQAETDLIEHLIIGVGINVNQEVQDYPQELRKIATSLQLEKGTLIERNHLIVYILQEWEGLYDLYLEHGFAPIKTLWETYTLSLGKTIVARTLSGNYEGMAQGITDEGVLLLEDLQGSVHKIYSADIETP